MSDDRFHYTVEFTCLKEKLFLSPGETEEEASEEIPEDFSLRMNDEELRKTFDSVEEITGRMLESRESSAIVSWICEEGLSPDLIRFAYRFCAEKRGNSRFPYVSSVIRDWERENIRTSEEAEKYLEDTDLRHNQYRRVMKALGFHRNPTEKEQDIMDTWFDQMGFDIGKILEACAKTSGISNPNINYVNSILLAWSGRDTQSVKNGSDVGGTAKGGNPAVKVKKLYEALRRRKEAELEERRRSVYASPGSEKSIRNFGGRIWKFPGLRCTAAAERKEKDSDAESRNSEAKKHFCLQKIICLTIISRCSTTANTAKIRAF